MWSDDLQKSMTLRGVDANNGLIVPARFYDRIYAKP